MNEKIIQLFARISELREWFVRSVASRQIMPKSRMLSQGWPNLRVAFGFSFPKVCVRQLCSAIAIERDLDKLRSLLRQLEFTLTEYSLDLQNRAVFLSNPSRVSD